VLFYVVESTLNPCAVTAEVASSSLVVPAISFQEVTGRDTGNSNPQYLIHRTAHPHGGQEFSLRDTALRDIAGLVESGVLIRNPGGGRSTSYTLARFGKLGSGEAQKTTA